MDENKETKTRNCKEESFLRAFRWGSGLSLGCLVSTFIPWIIIFTFFGIIGAISSIGPTLGAYDDFPVNEKIIRQGGFDRIAVIKIKGMIVESKKSSTFSSDVTAVSDVLNQIDKAQNDPTIAAIVLEIDSPGGEVGPTVKIYDRLLGFKESGKPIVAFVSNIAASGGYYVAMPADAIIAHRASWTGSIGVILETVNLQKLYEKIGYEKIVIKSGDLKDLGNEARPMTEGERTILNNLVLDSYNQFVADLSKSRKINDMESKAVSDGRIFTASEARKNKLIDEIGGTGDSYVKATELAKIKDPTIITYETPVGFSDFFMSLGTRINNLIGIKHPESFFNLQYILQ